MTIEIKIFGECAGDALNELRQLAGSLVPREPVLIGDRVAFNAAATAATDATAVAAATTEDGDTETFMGLPPGAPIGYTGPGVPVTRKRRTKAQIAADEAAATSDAPHVEGTRRTKAQVAADEAAKANISVSPENRVDPEAEADEATVDSGAEDSAETKAQDAADEAAETAIAPAAPATADDVRAALGRYMAAYGFAATTTDFLPLCGYAKVKDMPEDPAAYAVAISKLDVAIFDNPYKRERV